MKDFFLISLCFPCDYCHKVEPYKDDNTIWGPPGIARVVWVGSERATPWRSHCHFGCHDSGLRGDVTRILTCWEVCKMEQLFTEEST